MNARPTVPFTWTPIETGETGLVGTLAVGIYDGDTAIIALTTSGVNEIGSTGVYEADMALAPDDAGAYVLIASLDGSLDPDQVLTEVLLITSSAPFDTPSGNTYATRDELARILKIVNPNADEQAAMDRVLLAAAGEIDSEIDFSGANDLTGWQIALASEVNLERAVEHWRQEESPFGLLGLGSEVGPTHTATDSWSRHANKLAPLKEQWGLA
jgi:hypothetical protein